MPYFQIKENMNATASNRERLQAEAIEKQRRKHEHAMKVRERAKQLKQRKDLDEGLGNEIETYKATSDGKLIYNITNDLYNNKVSVEFNKDHILLFD